MQILLIGQRTPFWESPFNHPVFNIKVILAPGLAFRELWAALPGDIGAGRATWFQSCHEVARRNVGHSRCYLNIFERGR